jgi:outer membrane protein OmpA-like peptidoglycan-associated protein
MYYLPDINRPKPSMICNYMHLARFSVILLFFFYAEFSFSQLSVDTASTPEDLAKMLLGSNSNLVIKDVKCHGAKQSIGKFTTPSTKIMSKGFILSTGNIFDAVGPYVSKDFGTQTSKFVDADLAKLAAGPTYDVAVLEIYFISQSDSISFNYFFASNEYPEYVDKGVNDVFAFFLYDDETNIKKNLAVFGTADLPITVNNINDRRNSEYYIENQTWSGNNLQKFKTDKDAGELALTFNFSGMTTLLHAGSKVIPNRKYHLKIAIADVGDRIYDSAVFLEAGSFKSSGTVSADTTKIVKQSVLNKAEIAALTNKDTLLSKVLNIEFMLNSSEIKGENSFKILSQVQEVLKQNPEIKLKVYGHTDNSGDSTYNKKLSLGRAESVATFLFSNGIEKTRVSCFGLGDTKPIASNDTEAGKAKNRRVEFVFYKSK